MRYALAILFAVAACGGDDVYSVERLQDPNTCKDCHATHYTQWSGSMHAYASDDPVFVAMNRRGNRETNGALGAFCLKCHAPMAVENGTITDANAGEFDPATLAPAERGITCYFCHNVEKVVSDHNNGLVLANDQTMRGGAKSPSDSPAHHSKYDTLIRSNTNESELCGSCHDVTLPNGVALERSFAEWKESVFSKPDVHLTCGNCHMKPSDGVIADAPGLDVKSRTLGLHEHTFPAIDQALIAWPETAAQAAGIREILEPSIGIVGPKPRNSNRAPGGICLDPPGNLSVRIDSLNLGHSFPSGAAFDRRVWLEVTAYRADNSIVFQSGKVPDGVDPEVADPNVFGLWDRAFKTDNSEAHFFWEIDRVDSKLLKGSVTFDQNDPAFDHSVTARFNVPSMNEIVRIEAQVRIRPFPFETLHRLVDSGDLAPDVLTRIQTLSPVSASSTWLAATKGTGLAALTNCNPE